MSKLEKLTDEELQRAQFEAFTAYIQSLGAAGDVDTLLALAAEIETELDKRKDSERQPIPPPFQKGG